MKAHGFWYGSDGRPVVCRLGKCIVEMARGEEGAVEAPSGSGKFDLRGDHMKSKLVTCFALVGSLLLVCWPLSAHHGNIAYDEEHPITITGIVTEMVWSNPHCQIYFDVKDDNGKVVNWAVESQSPGILQRNGWTKRSIKPGDQITMTLAPSKNGAPVG